MMINFSEGIYSTGAILVFSALATKKLISLRIIYLLASMTFTTYGVIKGVPEIIFWNCINTCVNLIRIYFYYIETLPWFIKDTDLLLFNIFFKNFMKPGQFRKLIKLAPKNIYQDTTILAQGEVNQGIFFVIKINGQLQVAKSNEVLTELHEHSLFGEMSFIKNQPTSAAIRIVGSAMCYHWSYEKLQVLKAKYPEIFNIFTLILSNDLVSKLEV